MKNFELEKATGYELVMQDNIKEIDSKAYYLKHKKSGARVMLLLNEDNNKVFNIGFRTPVLNDTGVPHILEHSVLCGSKKYSAKDPFVELVKGSLNTFLNAMTFPDKTMYPVASCNDKDFENLMDVYMDAVLNPNIYTKDEIFRQEGWSYHIESEEEDITINGVVYNEMKGALSSPDSVVNVELYRKLLPNNTYKNVSGGDPSFIPDLTYEEFLDFHRKYYHPSNSYIYLYGDIDANDRLEWLDREYLSKYDRLEIDSSIPLHEAFKEPVKCKSVYGIGMDEDAKNKAYFSYAVVAGSMLDVLLHEALGLIDHSIISMPGAPLKKALIDAGICEDVYGGLDYTNQNVFTVIAKNADENRAEDFVRIVEDTLRKLIKEGIQKDSLKAALNKKEFDFREADYGSYPKGLFYCIDMMESWLYDESQPFVYLKADATFEALREKIDTDYFEEIIDKYILNNNHKVIMVSLPKQGLAEEKEKELEDKLKAYKESLSKAEIEKLVKDTKELLEYQSIPSTKEELEQIPLLKISDIGKKPEQLYMEEKEMSGIKTVYSDVFTNKIVYVNCSFDAGVVDKELIPYVALLARIIKNVDTKNYSYLEINNIIGIETGGMGLGTNVYTNKKTKEYTYRFEISFKVLYEKLNKAFEIADELINNTVLDNPKRIKEIISEIKLQLQSSIINSGHIMAANRAMTYFSAPACIGDMTNGIAYYKFIRELEKNFETDSDKIIANLKLVAQKVLNVNNLLMGVTADAEGFRITEEGFAVFKNKLNSEKVEKKSWDIVPERKNEGFITSSQVQYVARAGSFEKAGYEYTGAMAAFTNIMNYDYLWNNIRVKGGAYGCFAKCSHLGSAYFVSYRDPNLANTNEVFKQVPDYLKEFNADERDIVKFIIGTISNLDTPKTAKTKGGVAFNAYLSGITYETLEKERKEVLELSNKSVNELADIMKAVLGQGNLCVVGSAGKIKADAELFDNVEELFN